MGPYVAGNTMLVGFFAFAALHYFYLWWYSRQERVLIAFAIYCVAQAATSSQVVAMAGAKTLDSFQVSFDRHLTLALICLTLSNWVLALVTDVKAWRFVIPMTACFTLLIVFNLSGTHPIGRLTGIAPYDLPYGEQIMSFRRPRVAGWYANSIVLSAIVTKAFALYAAAHLWRRDRFGGTLIGLGTLSTLIGIFVLYFAERDGVALPFFGTWPSAILVLFISALLSRQHAQRSQQIAVAELERKMSDVGKQDVERILKEREQELRESNQFNAQIIASMPNGFIVMDHELRYRVWNNRMQQMSGLKEEEVVGKRPLELFPFLNSSGILDQVSRALAGETLTSDDFPFSVAESGRNGWSMQIMGPLRNSSNEIVGVLINVIDITARKDSESQLLEAIRTKEENVALLDTLQTAAPIGLAFVDRNLRYVRCNEALAKFRSVTAAEHVGRLVSEVVPDLWPQIEPLYHHILSGQEPILSWEVTGEMSARPGEMRSWQVRYYPVKIHEEIIGVGVIVIDETERKRSEEALRTSEERFRLLFEGARDAIFWADANTGILTHCNHAAELLLGRERNEIIGQHQSFLHPSEDAERYQQDFQRHAKTEQTTTVEAEVLRKDGRRVAVSIAPSVTTIGQQKVIQGIFRDVSEFKRIDEELRASRQRLEYLSRQLITTQETERRHLAYELHDEIGQVLTAIKINLHRSQRVALEDSQSNLNDVVEIVDKAINQVRNLALRLRPAQLDELGLVAAIHWLLKNQTDLGGIQEEFEVDVENQDLPSEMKTVCFRITQEALTNAIRHAQPSKIRVRLWTSDNKLFLSIEDDGIGFDVVEGCRRAAKGGSFGLVSIQERASLAAGCATIDSTPGLGTKVQVWLPLPVR